MPINRLGWARCAEGRHFPTTVIGSSLHKLEPITNRPQAVMPFGASCEPREPESRVPRPGISSLELDEARIQNPLGIEFALGGEDGGPLFSEVGFPRVVIEVDPAGKVALASHHRRRLAGHVQAG